mgnify:CR=1 FL=1
MHSYSFGSDSQDAGQDLSAGSPQSTGIGEYCSLTLLGKDRALHGTVAAWAPEFFQVLLRERLNFDDPVLVETQDLCVLGEVHWLNNSDERFLVTIKVEHRFTPQYSLARLRQSIQ